jgi:hypothetical protein
VSENHYFSEEELLIFPAEDLPLNHILDMAEATGDQLWVALSDSDSLEGGLARIGQDGVEIWIDTTQLGGIPRAIDVATEEGIVWILTNEGVITFTIP